MGTEFLNLVLSIKVFFNNVSLEKVLSRALRGLFLHYHCDFLILLFFMRIFERSTYHENKENSSRMFKTYKKLDGL